MTSVGAAPGPSSSKYLIVVPKRHKHMISSYPSDVSSHFGNCASHAEHSGSGQCRSLARDEEDSTGIEQLGHFHWVHIDDVYGRFSLKVNVMLQYNDDEQLARVDFADGWESRGCAWLSLWALY
ncbi:hypothetical protein CRG98_038839 [Punica granatum]|uniref:Uncharacterized protein n=1 Tax=Punica granatum TaxID=22663 RepID=A0A2I0IA01_PUNGR|nr:hypothetical protein CRG98_038839 [Punica granatum]